MKSFIIGLIVVVVIGILGIIFWQVAFKPKAPVTSGFEEVSFKPIEEVTPIQPETNPTTPNNISTNVPPNETAIIPPTFTQPPVTEDVDSYEVKKGDNLWNIAKKLYHDGTKYKIIYDANKDKLESPETQLKQGMKLSIPRTGMSETTHVEQPSETLKPEGATYYTVKKGDTLEKISVKCYKTRTKYHKIFEANRDKLSTPETSLKVGWKLVIPALSEPVKETPKPPAPEENKPQGTPEGK